jgi:molecular chaperone GrpE
MSKENIEKIEEEVIAEVSTDETIENTAEEIQEDSSEEIEEVDELTKVTAELAEMKDKYLRQYSEFDNFRKRTQKEKVAFFKTANEDLLLELIPIADDFERGMKANTETEDASVIKEGIALIYDKFSKLLSNKGLEPINATGEVFDTELHEAITQIPAPTEKMKGKVIDEVEKGYRLGEKVIRYSKVVIGA